MPSGRFQIRYPGPDGRERTAQETYERKGDADRALVLIEAQMSAGQWTDPERAKIKLSDHGSVWIEQRPGLRPRSADLYRWLFGKHIAPYIGGVPLGKLSTGLIREWRATLLRNGVSVSITAKAYRLLRAILMQPSRKITSWLETPAASVAREASKPRSGRFWLARGLPVRSAWRACTSTTCGTRETSSRLTAGAGFKDLMARVGHDSERAAMIYLHEAQGADQRITDAIDFHVQAARRDDSDDDDGPGGVLVPVG